MIYLAWIISIALAFFVGYHFKLVKKRIEVIEEKIEKKLDKKVEEPTSTFIDVDDPVAEALYERDKMDRILNGEQVK